MSELKHTSEPWDIMPAVDSYQSNFRIFSGSHYIGSIGNSDDMKEQNEKNAKRIVACVNACKGLSTDDLVKNGLVSAFGYEILNLEDINAELLDALKSLVAETKDGLGYEYDDGEWHVLDKARSAVAKASGEQQ